jgi:hypothetical protein
VAYNLARVGVFISLPHWPRFAKNKHPNRANPEKDLNQITREKLKGGAPFLTQYPFLHVLHAQNLFRTPSGMVIFL